MILAQAGLLPGNLDGLVPLALISLLVYREVRRAAAGPSSEPGSRVVDRALVPLLALFVIIVAVQLGRLL